MIIWSMIYKGLFSIRLAVTFWAAKVMKFKNWRRFPRIVWIDDILVKMRQVWFEIHFSRNTNEQSWSLNGNICWQIIGKIFNFTFSPVPFNSTAVNDQHYHMISYMRQTKAPGKVFVFPGSAPLVSVGWKIPRIPN